MPDWLAASLVAAVFSAAGAWAAVRVELRWLRRDVDSAHSRIDLLPCQVGGRRSYDRHQCTGGFNEGQDTAARQPRPL